MKLIIPKDVFSGNPTPPRLFLCTQGGKRIGELQGYEIKLNAKWNSYSELTFSINRNYTDIITGEAKVNQLFDKAETLRQVLVENIGYFIIQDQDDSFSDKDSKTITAFSVEYATSQKYLENWHINTGEDDSVEVFYETKKYGENRTVDSLYVAASGPYDAHRRYYIQEYDAKTLAYKYIQTQIFTEEEYLSHFEDGINADDPFPAVLLQAFTKNAPLTVLRGASAVELFTGRVWQRRPAVCPSAPRPSARRSRRGCGCCGREC